MLGDRARARWRRSRRCARASAARTRCVGQRHRRRPAGASTTRCFGDTPIDLPLDVLLGKPPRMTRDATRVAPRAARRSTTDGDRRSTRRVAPRAAAADRRRQDVPDHHRRSHRRRPDRARPDGRARGRCRSPTPRSRSTGFDGYAGEAMAMGERTPVALLDAAASARMAVAEAITNIAARADRAAVATSSCRPTGWRPPATPARTRALYDAVRAVGRGALPGARHRHPGRQGLDVDAHGVDERRRATRSVTAPLSLIVTRVRAGAPTCARALTPELRGATRRRRELLLVDLGARQEPAGRLGAGAGLRPARRRRRPTSTIRRCSRGFFAAVQELNAAGVLLAYHDRSRRRPVRRRCSRWRSRAACGLDIDARRRWATIRSRALFAEELGAVLAGARGRRRARARGARAPRPGALRRTRSAAPQPATRSRVRARRPTRVRRARAAILRARWSRDDARDAALRDDPTCADEEQAARVDASDPGLSAAPDVRPRRRRRRAVRRARRRAPARRDPARAGRQRPDRDGGGLRPRRLRGGRRAHDRPARGPRRPRATSAASRPAAASPTATCWAPARAGRSRSSSTPRARDAFAAFFARADTFALGVCNGCQMMSQRCKELIPGAEHWPRFVRNRREQFEARAVAGRRSTESPSMLLRGHGGLAHARSRSRTARAAPSSPTDDGRARSSGAGWSRRASSTTTARPTERYPDEPERLARRHHRAHHARRPRHDHDAAPRARVPHRAAVVAPARVGRGRPLDAHVPQRARLGRLTLVLASACAGRGPLLGAAPAHAPAAPSAREPERRRLGAGLGATIGRPLAPLRRRSEASPGCTCGRDRTSRRPSRRCRPRPPR